MRFPSLAVFAFISALSAPHLASATPLDCSSEQKTISGTHTGWLTDLIDRQPWGQDQVHFFFKDDADNKTYCVRQSTSVNPNIVALGVKAVLLHNKVTIFVGGDYWMTSIAYNGNE